MQTGNDGRDVVLIDVSGRADVTSHGGEISGKKLAGPLNVQTMGGEIDLDEVQGPLNAKSFAEISRFDSL
jgi:hypothetical protein